MLRVRSGTDVLRKRNATAFSAVVEEKESSNPVEEQTRVPGLGYFLGERGERMDANWMRWAELLQDGERGIASVALIRDLAVRFSPG